MINLLHRVPSGYVRPEWRECMVPGRPWWRPVLTPSGLVDNSRPVSTIRSDGKVIEAVAQITPDHEWEYYEEGLAELEAYDAENPLPQPEVRVGQVWVLLWQQTATVAGPLTMEDISAATVRSTTHGETLYGYFQAPLERDARILMQDPGWGPELGGALWWKDVEPEGFILLADPCRPDQAPWSSSSKGLAS